MTSVFSCEISPRVFSDHDFVFLSFQPTGNNPRSVCSLHCVLPRTTKIRVVEKSGKFRILETFGQDRFFSV